MAMPAGIETQTYWQDYKLCFSMLCTP